MKQKFAAVGICALLLSSCSADTQASVTNVWSDFTASLQDLQEFALRTKEDTESLVDEAQKRANTIKEGVDKFQEATELLQEGLGTN